MARRTLASYPSTFAKILPAYAERGTFVAYFPDDRIAKAAQVQLCSYLKLIREDASHPYHDLAQTLMVRRHLRVVELQSKDTSLVGEHMGLAADGIVPTEGLTMDDIPPSQQDKMKDMGSTEQSLKSKTR